jgi:hypothetical protein
MNPVEIRFSRGHLRQPGLWGKILRPNGSIFEYDVEKDYDLTSDRTTHRFTFPSGFEEGTYLIWGVKGFHQAGALSTCFILLKVTDGQQCEWQFPGHLAKFEAKNVLLIAQSETDLQPIYQALIDAKYAHMTRLQDFLRREGKDKSGAPPAPPAKT